MSRLRTAAAGTLAGRAVLAAFQAAPPGGAARWQRQNHRGEPVTLLAGPAFTLAAGALAVTAPVPPRLRAAAATAALGAGGVGVLDDLVGGTHARGFRGHLGSLSRGEVTTGAVKIGGIGLTGLVVGRLLHRRPADALVTGALVAGSANLVNLLDLRPGRATKSALLLAAPVLAAPGGPGDLLAGPVGVAAGLLGADLAERTMLGDGGANAMGAVVGVALAAAAGRRGRLALLAAIGALTAASEVVSFTRVIETTPALAWLDRLGRRPAVE